MDATEIDVKLQEELESQNSSVETSDQEEQPVVTQTETKPAQVIPYARFQTVNSEKNELKRRLEELEAKINKTETPEQPPKIDNFSDEEAYQNALLDFKAKKAAERILKEREEEARQRQEIAQSQGALQGFENDLAIYAAKNPQFNEDYGKFPELKLSPAVSEAILNTDGKDSDGNALSAKAYHYFYQNPDKVSEFNALSPLQAAVKIGRLTVSLSQTKKPTTNAPHPPERISNSSPGKGGKIDFHSLDGADFMKAYNSLES